MLKLEQIYFKKGMLAITLMIGQDNDILWEDT